MRGSSGARINIYDDYVEKLDTNHTGTRVREQGIWLRAYCNSDAFPRVTQVLADGYTMELLEERELPKTQDDVDNLCVNIMLKLAENLWHDRATYHNADVISDHVQFSKRHHNRYVTLLLKHVEMSYLRGQLHAFADMINWEQLTVARTHGDPIVENVLYRPGKYSPVITDPIPACPAVPDLEVVDVGRLIQSSARYEEVRYGEYVRNVTTFRESTEMLLNTYMKRDFHMNDARAALYFAAIHMLRGVRSAPEERRNVLRALVIMITTEACRWMR